MPATAAQRPFPRGALLGAAALVAFSLVTATVSRVTGVGTTHTPVPSPQALRELRFLDQPDGSVAVLEPRAERPFDVLAPGTNGFVRGVLRGLARERKRQSLGAQDPFRLILGQDGRLVLEDPATDRRIDLEAFGPTNRAAFARLLTAGRTAP